MASPLTKLQKRLMGVKKLKIEGINFEIKKVTPEDFLGRDGIPIGKWESESKKIADIQMQGGIKLSEVTKTWKHLFKRAVVSIECEYDGLDSVIDAFMSNYSLCSRLYEEISVHNFGVKKKSIFKRLFQMSRP